MRTLWAKPGDNLITLDNYRHDKKEMKQGTETIWFYCIGTFLLALACGLIFGFTDSHTPPLTFMVELFVIPVGIISFTVDIILLQTRNRKQAGRLNAHLFGFVTNGLLITYILTR